MTALIRFVLAVLAGAMIDDADLDEVFSDSFDMILDAVQHLLEVAGVVGSAAVIVLDHLLVLIITQARRSRLWRSIPSLRQLQTAQRILFFIVLAWGARLVDRRLHAPGWGRHFLHRVEFVADRLEGAELVLAFAEVIGIGAVSGIGGLFRSHRQILVETGLFGRSMESKPL
jgi:hypothetical protein